jgi:hypothetical protein
LRADRHLRGVAQTDDLGREVGRPLRQAGLRLYANEEHGQKMRRYWTSACKTCAIKDQCTPQPKNAGSHDGSTRTFSKPCSSDWIRIPRPRAAAAKEFEHPFGTLKMRMGATHFLMKTLPKVATTI